MNIIERAQRQLARSRTNSLKVAALFLINAAGWFALGDAGDDDLASPWNVLTLLPAVLIYVAERLGKVTWFMGMTLPSLYVMAGSIALLWVLNTKVPIPSTFAYCVLVAWIAAFGFLLFRMWTFERTEQRIN